MCAGFHEFAEFTADDIGTVDSGLNSMVLANNSEFVLLPINEPTFGTKRKSQIQTYLDHNAGPGVQHLALKTDNIFKTLRQMRDVSDGGGMDFMPRTPDAYYKCGAAGSIAVTAIAQVDCHCNCSQFVVGATPVAMHLRCIHGECSWFYPCATSCTQQRQECKHTPTKGVSI
jgi:hypothetical protein